MKSTTTTEFAQLISSELSIEVLNRKKSHQGEKCFLSARETVSPIEQALDRFAIEVVSKVVTPGNISSWWAEAVVLARAAEKIPCLAYRPNRGEWRLRVPLTAVQEGMPEGEPAELSLTGFCALVKRFDPLTGKQRRFVQEYLVDLNATQAAIRAGYSSKTAYSIGNENLKKPEIQAALIKAQSERAERTKLSADEVVQDLLIVKEMAMGRRKMKKTLMVGNEPQEFEVLETNVNAARQALELLGKHKDLKLFTDKVEQDTTHHISRQAWDLLKPSMDLPSQRPDYSEKENEPALQ